MNKETDYNNTNSSATTSKRFESWLNRPTWRLQWGQLNLNNFYTSNFSKINFCQMIRGVLLTKFRWFYLSN